MSDDTDDSKELPPLPPPELVIQLTPPIEVEGAGTVFEIRLQEPTAAQIRKAETVLRGPMDPQKATDFQCQLITIVSKMNRQVIDSLPISVIEEGYEYLMGFRRPRRRIGKS